METDLCQDGRTLCRNDAKREKAKKTCGFTVSMSVNSSRVKCENEKIRAVCVLFCADEYVCTFGGRSAVDAEEFFPQSCGGAVSGCFAFAGGRAVSYPQGKSAVFSDAVNVRHDGSAV